MIKFANTNLRIMAGIYRSPQKLFQRMHLPPFKGGYRRHRHKSIDFIFLPHGFSDIFDVLFQQAFGSLLGVGNNVLSLAAVSSNWRCASETAKTSSAASTCAEFSSTI